MNPFILGALVVIATSLLAVSYRLVNKIDNKKVRVSMRMVVLAAFLVPVLFFFFQQPQAGNGNAPRRYVDTSGFH